jgi:hypothetical protein
MHALLGPILAQALSLSVQDTTTVRLRRFGDTTFYDADTQPSVELALRTQRTSFSIGYGPTLTLDSIGSDPELVILHAGSAAVSTRWRRHFLTLSQQGGYGEQNFLAAPIEPGVSVTDPNAPPLPTATPETQSRQLNEVISYGFASNMLSLTHLLTRRLSLSESAGYSTSSGFDDLARTIFPLQREVFAGITVGYALTRGDTLFARGEARYVLTGPVGALIVIAEERWAKRWTPNLSTELGAGAAYTESEDSAAPEAPPEKQVVPVATAALRVGRGRPNERDELQIASQLTADVDRTSGEVDERVLWSVGSEHIRGRLTLSASGVGSQSLENDTENALTSISGSIAAAYALSDSFAATTGISAAWQHFPGAADVPLFWTGSLGVRYAPAAYRF